MPSLVQIGLTDQPKSGGGGCAPPAPRFRHPCSTYFTYKLAVGLDRCMSPEPNMQIWDKTEAFSYFPSLPILSWIAVR